MLSTPSSVNLGPRWMGWALSDLNANVLWKVRTGNGFWYTPPGAPRHMERGPMDTRTDLSVEKMFNSRGRVRTSLFVEVRNLFNQADDSDRNNDYQRWGLQTSRPDNADFLLYGESQYSEYVQRPRETNLGLRISF